MSKQNKDNSITLRFLRDYQGFASRGHLVTASALRERMHTSDEADERKLLAVRVYAEFIAALEDLGALCIAIRHRNDDMGLVYGYLTYGQTRNAHAPKTSLREIFKLISTGNVLAVTLCLPTIKDISQAAPELMETALPQLYAETNMILNQVGKTYLHDNGTLVRIYNKTKHGFVVISDDHVFDPKHGTGSVLDGTWIVVNNPNYLPHQDPEDRMVELFLAEESQVDLLIDRITEVRGAVRTLCELTALLIERGIIS